MNSVFSIDDFSDPFWEAPSISPDPTAMVRATETAAAVEGLNLSQSEWPFERLLEEISTSVSAISAVPSFVAETAIGVSFAQSRLSASGAGDVEEGDADVLDIKKQQNRNHDDRDPGHGDQNHYLPSGSSGMVPVDYDEYRAVLKSKLDLACAAAVALKASSVKPDKLSASANNQIWRAESGSQAQGSPVGQSEFGASSVSISATTPEQKKPNAPTKQATSGSSREDSDDDDDLYGDTENTENMDPADVKRARRMLSNRESARRSRRRKQEQMTELETQVGQLRIDHSSLLERLSDLNHKYDESAVDNRILKADIETLRAKVKMAEETVKRVTGMNPLLLARSSIPSTGTPFVSNAMDPPRIAALQVQQGPNPNPKQITNQPLSNIAGLAIHERLMDNSHGNKTLAPRNLNQNRWNSGHNQGGPKDNPK